MEFGDNTKDEKTLFCFILHQMVSLFHGVGCSFILFIFLASFLGNVRRISKSNSLSFSANSARGVVPF